MKKLILAAVIALVAFPHAASAQQYVYPIYSQNSVAAQPYAMPEQNYAPAPSYAPAPNAIPLSSASHNTGYGSAVYGNQPAPTATPASYPAVGDSYATYAANAQPWRPGHNWSGCYLGGYGGGAFAGDTHVNPLVSQGGTFSPGTPYNLTAESYSYNTGSNFIGGGTLGCNLEFPQRYGYLTGLVIGAEGEGGSFGVSNSSVDPNSNHSLSDTSEKTNLGGWDAIAAGRVGAAFDRTFIYGKFGAVFGEANTTITDGSTTPPGTGTINAHGHQNIADAAIGGGIEYALNHSWSVKGEYMYLDTTDSYLVCGAGGGTASGSTFCSSHSLEGTHTFKIGLNYHFDDLFGDSRSGTEPRW